jgi:hypothetical protein
MALCRRQRIGAPLGAGEQSKALRSWPMASETVTPERIKSTEYCIFLAATKRVFCSLVVKSRRLASLTHCSSQSEHL